MSPSSAWNQLHSRSTFWTAYSPRGRRFGSRSGNGGGVDRDPMYVQMTSFRSTQG